MRRRSSVQHPTSSVNSDSESLHPTLQAALGSLDVRIEEELARYRQVRGIQQKSVNSRQRSSRPRLSSADQSEPLLQLNPSPDRDPVESQYLRAAQTDSLATDFAIAKQGEPASAALARRSSDGSSEIDQVNPHRLTSARLSADDSPSSSLANVGSVDPDDYLESSEELLRSLDESAGHVDSLDQLDDRPESSILASLLTPLGMGSMLLLLVSSTTLGYLITNPDSFGLRIWGDRPQNSDVASQDGESGIISTPDLSAGEFQDLNLDTLTTLPDESTPVLPSQVPNLSNPDPGAEQDVEQGTPVPSGAAAPVTPSPGAPVPSAAPTVRATQSGRSMTNRQAPSSRPAPAPSAAPSSASTPSPAPSRAPQPAAPSSASPSPSSAPSVASAPATSSSSRYYYVVTDYTGDRSLDQARERVSGAYVRNFSDGARVQLGAFNDREGAQNLAESLRQQGVSAQVLER
ncbi:MAG TPA: SPOR domain-containing protein [Elainellaceae cyanobacterium]